MLIDTSKTSFQSCGNISNEHRQANGDDATLKYLQIFPLQLERQKILKLHSENEIWKTYNTKFVNVQIWLEDFVFVWYWGFFPKLIEINDTYKQNLEIPYCS